MKQISDIHSILLKEIDNDKYVYLYLEGDNWCAYERSAYYLVSMKYPVILDIKVDRGGDGTEFMKASFKTSKMQYPLSHDAILKVLADDQILFQITQKIEGFTEWKERRLKASSIKEMI